MFHNTVPHLAAVTLSFEVLSGITIEQTRDLIAKMNDQIGRDAEVGQKKKIP